MTERFELGQTSAGEFCELQRRMFDPQLRDLKLHRSLEVCHDWRA
ncbi:MAG TPA: hypothetical protein VHW01_24185 [Polyangiaceae bacterium]|nr:hypothetical protein [Polyangiaceae bacterium]